MSEVLLYLSADSDLLLHGICSAADSGLISLTSSPVFWKLLGADSVPPQGRNHLFLLPGVSTWPAHSFLTGKQQELSIATSVRTLQYFSMESKSEVLRKHKIVIILH